MLAAGAVPPREAWGRASECVDRALECDPELPAAHAVAASRVGDPISPEDARWVRQLYQRNGRMSRASWKSFQDQQRQANPELDAYWPLQQHGDLPVARVP